MKKLFILFVILFFSVNFMVSAHSGCEGRSGSEFEEGLIVGLEFGIEEINCDDERTPYLTGRISYGHSFLDETLDVYAKLEYTSGLTDDFDQSLYFSQMAGYNLGLGTEATLSLILLNEFDKFRFSHHHEDDEDYRLNDHGEENIVTGIFTPILLFNYEFDFGDLYTKIGTPVTYIQYEKNADTIIGLDFTLGFGSLIGLSFEATVLTQLAPDADFIGVETILAYEFEPLYFELSAFIPKDVSDEGFSITPHIEFELNAFTFYLNCSFAGIGAHDHGNGNGHDHSLSITPALGIKYSF